jgi:hypothetical protein
MDRGNIIADAEVADKLYHRAYGYSHEAVKRFMPAGASDPVCAPYVEHYPPDTMAATRWLGNRQRRLWSERMEGHRRLRSVTQKAGTHSSNDLVGCEKSALGITPVICDHLGSARAHRCVNA